MFARALAPLALAGALVLPLRASSAQQFHYAAGTAQYRMIVSAKVSQTAMGQTNEMDVSSGQKFTMALNNQAADTLAMTLTIDSIGSSTMMGPVPGLDKLVGQKVQAWVSPSGQYYSSKAPTGAGLEALSNVAEELTHVLPPIRVALAPGATWTDTVSDTGTQNGVDVEKTVVSVYTVAGDTSVAGGKAWKVTRNSTAVTSGKGTMQGQAMTLEGSSKGTGLLLITPAGAFLGSTGTEDAKAKITLTDAGVEVNVGTNATSKVERVN
ncbi:MAG TPA: hypothetical protein VNE60_12300 [Gemmatimonadaceae bacterium]|nr:hypothetical protein [Gemmatimonadaceae bacterium]